MLSEGMSRVTTAPAPITHLSPILTPGRTITPAPIHTSSPTVMSRESCFCPAILEFRSRKPWLEVLNIDLGPTRQFFPNVNLPPMSALKITCSFAEKLSPNTICPPRAVIEAPKSKLACPSKRISDDLRILLPVPMDILKGEKPCLRAFRRDSPRISGTHGHDGRHPISLL